MFAAVQVITGPNYSGMLQLRAIVLIKRKTFMVKLADFAVPAGKSCYAKQVALIVFLAHIG